MTALVPYREQNSLELAPSAWKLAEKIAATDFVPPALRGKPEAVLACILAGHEAGVSPMQALSKIHIIEGRPAMSSELMRALVLQHGHELNYEEVTSTKVVAAGRRNGSDRWTRVEWTMDDAKRGGLDGKTNWRRWPRAMLIARATAELCRMVFPDVLAGISHTVEELTDGDGLPDGILDLGPAEPPAAQVPKKPTAQRAAITSKRSGDAEQLPPPPAGEVPPLPGEEPADDVADEIADGELIEDDNDDQDDAPELPEDVADADVVTEEDPWASGTWDPGDFPTDPTPEDRKRYTGPQLVAIKLHERFGISGSGEEARARRLAAISFIMDREVVSSKELTPAEISFIANWIDEIPQGVNPFAGEPAEVAADAPELPAEPPAKAPAPARPTAPAPKAPKAPDAYTAEDWRELLTARKVKVTELLREAQRLAGLQTPPVSVGTLDDIAASGIAGDLVGWVEDLYLERRK